VLVLSRRPHESIVLPDLGITVRVTAIRPGVVRIGIDAPREVRVTRRECMRRRNSTDADRCCAFGELPPHGTAQVPDML
jgi:carbon storage regulator CsrA